MILRKPKSTRPAAGLVARAVRGVSRKLANGLAILKDFGVTSLGDYGWRVISGGRQSTRFAGSDFNWDAEAGDLKLNGVIAICLGYIMDQVVKPDLQVVNKARAKDGNVTYAEVVGHPLTNLLHKPNTEYTGESLLQAIAVDLGVNGNAYCVKVRGGRNGTGPVKELWWVDSKRIWPIAPEDGGPTQFYAMRIPKGNGQTETAVIPRYNVVHFKDGIDEGNPRIGWSRTRPQLRSVVSDNEVDSCTAITLRNLGVIGAIISPADPSVEIDEQQQEELKRLVRNSTTGDGRGNVIAPNVAVKVDYLGRSAQDMALTTIGDRPQARICAAFGIDPAAVGLLSNAGGKGEKYGSMRKEARESSFENGIIPSLSIIGRTLTNDLGPDFDVDGITSFVRFDLSSVQDLQPDINEEYTRHGEVFKNGGYTLNEYREKINEPPAPEPWGSMFWWQLAPAPSGEFGVVGGDGDSDSGDPKGGKGGAGKAPKQADDGDGDED